jgi:hypothetical protein
VPFVNGHFFAHYCQTGDNTLDYAMEPIRLNNRKLYTLAGLFYAFFGYFLAPEDNVMAIYRTSQTRALPRIARPGSGTTAQAQQEKVSEDLPGASACGAVPKNAAGHAAAR